ncbi:MAG TPA: hypothetical protein VHK90_02920 [Thermoanaerobaculia bacterium]|nr:hypothetical protein [Thermoanaerobaculia bacterium]
MWQQVADVVRDIESRSSAELVVEIRARAGSYAHADSRCGALLALLSLAVLVFMPLVVPPITVLLDPIPFYFLGVVISRRSDALRRLFSTRSERLEAVRTRAAALFHDRRVSETEGETGVLFFASLLERRIEVLADRGVLRAVDPSEWNAALAELHGERSIDPEHVVAALRKIGALLERALPAGDVNVDELPSVPEVSL